MELLPIIAILYAWSGVAGVLAYLPTIKDLARGISSANVSSYVIWTASAGVALLYAVLVISDLLLEIIVGLNFAACAIILVLAVNLKHKGGG